MLIQVQAVQIPKFWEAIKFATVNSEITEAKYVNKYCLSLLHDLLAGKKCCFVGQKDGKVFLVVILEFLYSNTYEGNYLYFNNLYAFEKQADKVWFEVFTDLHKLAITKDCKAIMGDSANPRVAEINKSVGAKCISSRYVYFV